MKVEEIDIHGMTIDEAIDELTYFLNHVDRNTDEVHVIHGYNRGNALQTMVRRRFHHKKIDRKLLSLNSGITILKLKTR